MFLSCSRFGLPLVSGSLTVFVPGAAEEVEVLHRVNLSQVTINGDWAETMFYNMLSGKLPVKTPRIFFADMNRRTTMPRRKAFFKVRLMHVADLQDLAVRNFIWVMECPGMILEARGAMPLVVTK